MVYNRSSASRVSNNKQGGGPVTHQGLVVVIDNYTEALQALEGGKATLIRELWDQKRPGLKVRLYFHGVSLLCSGWVLSDLFLRRSRANLGYQREVFEIVEKT